MIETATAACSVALIEGGDVIDARHEVVGRGHAERLVPMIGELAGGGRADRILVDCGPGSFTGIRVGIAAARGLGIGWSVPVTGYGSLSLVAAATFAAYPVHDSIAIVMEGGHGEVFMQGFASNPFAAIEAMVSITPASALARVAGRLVAGDGVRHLLALDPDVSVHMGNPDAADAWRLPEPLRMLAPSPIYGRAPDAKLPGGRSPV